jgi:hypothetical protein
MPALSWFHLIFSKTNVSAASGGDVAGKPLIRKGWCTMEYRQRNRGAACAEALKKAAPLCEVPPYYSVDAM